jgi:hypothetical protein
MAPAQTSKRIRIGHSRHKSRAISKFVTAAIVGSHPQSTLATRKCWKSGIGLERLAFAESRDRSPYSHHRDLVFCHPESGHPLDHSKLIRRFKETLERAEVHQITFHELRHTFGTRMAAAGTPLRTLQHWMGHSDSKTTPIYAHYQPSEWEADAVDRAFAERQCFGGALNYAKTLLLRKLSA